ncbi:phosphoribosylglycinamide formyltransferase [Streptomonospora sp. NEAU-YY374]|nr:phosphoribosylglycinamide formyltransferase [Streptomonospora nanhaiensis]
MRAGVRRTGPRGVDATWRDRLPARTGKPRAPSGRVRGAPRARAGPRARTAAAPGAPGGVEDARQRIRFPTRRNTLSARVVVLISGTGSNMAALLDAAADRLYGAEVVAVGSDRDAPGLALAERAGVATFTVRLADHRDRAEWDAALSERIAAFAPDLVVSAGFMRLLGPAVLDRHTVINTHPALLPAFPGTHAVRDALAYGVRITGATVHFVDSGMDTGPVIDQVAVPVLPGDDAEALHERIKTVERRMLVDVVGRLAREGWTVEDRHVRLGSVEPGPSPSPGYVAEENR